MVTVLTAVVIVVSVAGMSNVMSAFIIYSHSGETTEVMKLWSMFWPWRRWRVMLVLWWVEVGGEDNYECDRCGESDLWHGGRTSGRKEKGGRGGEAREEKGIYDGVNSRQTKTNECKRRRRRDEERRTREVGTASTDYHKDKNEGLKAHENKRKRISETGKTRDGEERMKGRKKKRGERKRRKKIKEWIVKGGIEGVWLWRADWLTG